jgi:hypothetical protein
MYCIHHAVISLLEDADSVRHSARTKANRSERMCKQIAHVLDNHTTDQKFEMHPIMRECFVVKDCLAHRDPVKTISQSAIFRIHD